MSAQPSFPKLMRHPHHRPGAAGRKTAHPSGREMLATYESGRADLFPPVQVHDPDQEAQHRALGYIGADETPKVEGFSEYPKWVHHPDHAAEIRDQAGTITTAELFPPRLVRGEEEELAAMDEGYGESGRSDPAAYQRQAAMPYDPNRPAASEYPKMVDGVLVQDPNKPASDFQEYPKWVGAVLVNSRAEEDALLAQAAGAETADAAPPPEKSAERQQLLVEAAELGVEANKHWSLDTLRQKVEAARAARRAAA